MTIWIRNAALATIAVAGLLAVAQPLWAGAAKTVGEGKAITTELGGNAKAVTYWSDRPDGWQVVTTVDSVTGAETDLEQHAVVRFSSMLQPGQSQEISLPRPIGETAQILRIERREDGIAVALAAE